MLNRVLLVVVVVPLAVVLIALAVANRAPVAFTLDPFNPGNPALTIEMPLFVLIFAAAAVGLLLGSMATWLKQGRYRRAARQSGQEAERLRLVQSETQRRAADQAQPARPALPKP